MSGDGAPEVLEIDNSRYLPSVVCLDEEGTLLTGRDAAQDAAIHPEMAELQPKRALVSDTVIRLGDRDVDTVEIVAATLRRVAEEATRRRGRPPFRAVLTHPAAWTERETARLAEAAVRAGLPSPEFVPEPVAAAVHHASSANLPVGAHIAVYDLGGGTFDTAVLRRTAGGFEICGPPGGDPDFGGADVSEALREVVGAQVRHEAAAEWDELWTDSSIRGQQRRASQLDYLTQAKESLSGRTVVNVPVHAADTQVRITRTELEAAIEDRLRPTVDELVRTVEAAGIGVGDLAAIYLTGGSSRIPRVSELIAERTGLLPVAEGDPKAVVCLGALTAVTAPPPPAPPAVDPFTGPVTADPATVPLDSTAASSAEPATVPLAPASGPATVPLAPATVPVAEPTLPLTEPTVPAAEPTLPLTEPATAPLDTVPPPATLPMTVPPPAPAGGRARRFTRGRVVMVAGVALLLAGLTATTATALTRAADPGPTPTPVVTTPEPAVTTPSPEPVIVAAEPDPTTPEPEETTPEPEETTPEPEETTPSARDNLSSSQQDLYDKLDFDVLEADSCKEWTPGIAGVEASIQCNPVADLDYKVLVAQFDDSSSLAAAMKEREALATDEGDCSDGDESVGPWTQGGEDRGRLACYWTQEDGEDYFKVVWSFDDELIMAIALDSSATEVGQWWYDNEVLD